MFTDKEIRDYINYLQDECQYLTEEQIKKESDQCFDTFINTHILHLNCQSNEANNILVKRAENKNSIYKSKISRYINKFNTSFEEFYSIYGI